MYENEDTAEPNEEDLDKIEDGADIESEDIEDDEDDDMPPGDEDDNVTFPSAPTASVLNKIWDYVK